MCVQVDICTVSLRNTFYFIIFITAANFMQQILPVHENWWFYVKYAVFLSI